MWCPPITKVLKSFGRVFPHIKFNHLYLEMNSSVVVLNSWKLIKYHTLFLACCCVEVEYNLVVLEYVMIVLVVLEEVVIWINERMKE